MVNWDMVNRDMDYVLGEIPSLPSVLESVTCWYLNSVNKVAEWSHEDIIEHARRGFLLGHLSEAAARYDKGRAREIVSCIKKNINDGPSGSELLAIWGEIVRCVEAALNEECVEAYPAAWQFPLCKRPVDYIPFA